MYSQPAPGYPAPAPGYAASGPYPGAPAAQPYPGGAIVAPAPGYGMPPASGYGGPQPGMPGYPGAPVPGYPGAMPGVAMMNPVVVDPWAVLASVPGIVVKEKVKLLEALIGWEQSNAYKAYAMNPDGRPGMELFTFFEKSDCCQRQFCGPARGFEMAVQSSGMNQQFLHFERPFKCTCLCLARPELFIKGMDGRVLGSVYSNWRCCDDVMTVFDEDGKEIFRIVGACCQCGKFCQCPCPPFDEITFAIHGAGGDGEPLGHIKRVWPGCGKELLGDVDTFSCLFPPRSSPKERACLMGAVMLIDFMYFEKSNKGAMDGALGAM